MGEASIAAMLALQQHQDELECMPDGPQKKAHEAQLEEKRAHAEALKKATAAHKDAVAAGEELLAAAPPARVHPFTPPAGLPGTSTEA